MIPPRAAPACPDWTAARDADPVVQRFRALFALLDWALVPERDPRRPWPGSPPHPRRAYLKALLVKLVEHHPSATRLRAYLVEHPLLVLELGFRPVWDATQPYGVDVARTVPGARWLRHQQQHLDHAVLQRVLADTVHTLQQAVPDLGTTVAVDVKHCYAWVRENNPKEHVAERHDPTRQPGGDPDCRLGVKRTTNQQGVPTGKEYLWGYGTGIVSAITPTRGDVVLAEWTQPFNAADITYYHPLYQQATAHLGQHPTNVTADAAFDAWHVYQSCAAHGGTAAIPLNARGPRPARSPAGHPLCDHGHGMRPTGCFQHEDGYQAQHYRCPLRGPDSTGTTCDHPQFAKGGCTKVVNLERGAQQRLALDRQAEPYLSLYRQRTSAERIYSQATDLGIERPKARRLAAVARLNTLTYIVINLRVLQRLQGQPATVLC